MPDISNANVARVLRIAEREYLFLASSLTKPEATVLAAERAAECRDIADALDPAPALPRIEAGDIDTFVGAFQGCADADVPAFNRLLNLAEASLARQGDQ